MSTTQTSAPLALNLDREVLSCCKAPFVPLKPGGTSAVATHRHGCPVLLARRAEAA